MIIKIRILITSSLLNIFLNILTQAQFTHSNFDVTVVSYINFKDGLNRLAIGFIENFKNKLNINFIPTYSNINVKDIPSTIKSIINNQNETPGNVALLFDPLFKNNIKFIPNSYIKIAYSMIESTQLPEEWVDILNKEFDAVLVPAPFLEKVYKKSGVNIPIFLLPCGIYIDDFLSIPIKDKKNTPFVFGCSATFLPRKNQEILLNAFLNKFGNNKNIKLKLHGRYGDIKLINKLKKIIREKKAKNVELILGPLEQKHYVNFLNSLDCYVLVSKGEGFSITPRESISLGIPTIISNNTAHKELTQTTFFIPLKSKIKEPADYRWLFGKYCGYNFNIMQKDLEQVLEEVYNNYEHYLKKSQLGREWVKQYRYNNLEQKYINIIKPKKIIFGNNNIITDDYVMTSSKKLFEKYKNIITHVKK
ncbi:glycosyltransferase [Candidatus Babela massiliensis]|uniref:Glycosyltransferase n=1 Tax=Candidatus Babela massiliensis TaxID=673862 RepID=V6DGR6_9BACT|nr:glycosyltransferase [Candidatus Babela massiliensis]CDK30744.1 Glycosyltransferase [Candidatus Babela massiliensis]